ncbi:hypothetical protein C8R43DRAFT_1125692 [Mycena crocata]|nr:hypothetical protein C8R43DRAFT_1125692 [Mycena crocata]
MVYRVTALAFVNHLPSELLIIIFHHILGDYWKRMWSSTYEEQLFRLTAVCRSWRQVALSTPELWSNFRIRMDSSLSLISLYIDRSTATPIMADFDLHGGGAIPAVDIFRRFFRLFPRFTRLRLRVRDRSSLNEISLCFALGRFDSLVSLDISCDAAEGTMARISLTAPLPALQSLRLRRVCVGWTVFPTFRCITTLVIRNLSRSLAPDWDDWVALQFAAPSLQRICLRNTGCIDVPVDARPLYFLELSDLDLDFGDDNPTLMALVATFRTAALSFLSIQSRTSAVLSSISTHAPNLATITRLNIRLISVDITVVTIFLRHLSSLKILDLRASDSKCLAALQTPLLHLNADPIFSCPSLQQLAVVSATPPRIRAFIETRGDLNDSLYQVSFIAP